ncbi:RhoGAP domain containing protein [Entamoeba histolytica HM-1:IMSS-B]|uniref:RhoGAP domain containing protein n=6 Tax=Entamoeba histolytica TaxID=5759 RepID=C4LXW1_ENTH1|nr:RhoGAP domain containing protein [Entamoeba histolytica HM-1:IMSS]EMD43605.1 RhoGAP domain containing protein [Entamoeba histolytica KU27]EMH75983.1 RhoGAP domain containing protein [Entamoeba histolytica HM-1:IMSS-B]EMS14045.1 RhoGAP domain containing protein [Entamoeba histolytica HM-3:IMSS]ENY64085.1 RhoGAP domain containing protein [Entamoeba histolytica HM-1:IMSS-A]GAT93612.1 rhogap domain containing protein [Entamoeba histolytica]|eukprot:XP_655947.1 RhoGAP domain containing protein [Entamoeba histolytica HM-1:IMSS]
MSSQVKGDSLKIIRNVFSKVSAIKSDTITASIRGENDSIQEFRIDIILNHILFTGTLGVLSSSLSTPNSCNSPLIGMRPHKSDIVLLEKAQIFAVPLISSMNYNVVESTIAISGIYGIPIITMDNTNTPHLKVAEKLVITRASNEFIQKTTIILDNINKFEQPILSIPYIPLFGQPLKNVMLCHRPLDNLQVPYFVFTASRYLENCATNEVGIFRLSGDAKEMKIIRKSIEEGIEVDWTQYNIHSITNIIKQFFREMPDGLVNSFDMNILIKSIENDSNETDALVHLKEALNQIYKPSHDILDILSHLVNRILFCQEITLMNEKNLLICLSPSLRIQAKVLSLILFHHDNLFDKFTTKYSLR